MLALHSYFWISRYGSPARSSWFVEHKWRLGFLSE